MGWLFMRDMRGHATPRAYLDNQFTYRRDDHRLTVLASSTELIAFQAAQAALPLEERTPMGSWLDSFNRAADALPR